MTRRPDAGDVLRVFGLPFGPLAAILGAPREARRHPRADEVRGLRRAGWTITDIAISEEPSRAAITLERDGQRRVVADNDLSFTAHAAALRVALPAADTNPTKEAP